MQYSLSLLALASSAVATFRNAPPFPCPANQDNKCTDLQKPGFSFDDLPNGGPFFQYKDFVWNGWTAQPAAPGGRFGKRTFGKGIGGICGPNKNQSPSFGCGPKVDKFSLGSIHVKPEFDCDLEFHYDMPDGKKCKHRNFCRKTGTTVVNTQCGGAKNVTIVYPPQPNKPKPSCSIVVPTVSFDCSTASSTVPPKTTTTSTTSTTSASSVPATTTSTTLSTASSKPASSVPSQGTTSGDIVSTSTSPAPASSTAPGTSTSETTSVKPVPSSSFIFPNSSTTALSSSTPGSTPGTPGTPASTASSTSGSTPGTTAGTPPATTSTTTYVTTFDTTSTLFTTVTSTITSCEPTVPDCPAGGVKTTVVTVATSTTICPVTSTLTSVVSQPPVQTPPVNPPKDTSSTGPVGGVSTTSAGTGTVVKPPSTTSAIPPIETLPCPNVVPSCLNTFLFSVGCSHNSDAACFCPDTIFVKNIFDCIYAHGESDQVISEAVIFFQGICAPYIGSNPGIATDATITTYITATATPTVSIVTTVTLDVTTVVPCTDSLGSTIPSSSTTSVLSTILTIPQVGFTTGTNNDVAIIPVTTALPVETQPGGGFVPTGDNGFFTPTPAPTGTGGLVPSALPSIVTAGAGRTGAGVGFAVAAAGLIAAML